MLIRDLSVNKRCDVPTMFQLFSKFYFDAIFEGHFSSFNFTQLISKTTTSLLIDGHNSRRGKLKLDISSEKILKEKSKHSLPLAVTGLCFDS